MRTMGAVIALALTGCHSVPDARLQADIVIAAYEAEYGDVSEGEASCVYETRVTYARETPRCCKGDFWCFGCMRPGMLRAHISIRDDLSEVGEIATLRHEYTHVLLWCMTGDAVGDHDAPEFGYSGDVMAYDSLGMSVPLDNGR